MKNYSTEHLMGLLGTVIAQDNENYGYIPPNVDAPESFDARTQWGSWVHPIRDQSQCGSCWAFGSTEAFSDRFAIASKGSIDVVFSPQDLVSCDSSNYGCSGGYLNKAWAYLKTTGAVSDKCDSYKSASGTAPKCSAKCDDGSAKSGHRYKCKGTVAHPTTVSAIKAEIYANGPVEGGFSVYEDFYSYKSGVYHYTKGSLLGGHAIKVLGWGNANGMDYWLCANSWGSSWGESGYFRIKQGDCGINDQIYACTPDTTGPSLF